jgi:glycosyltransferase 2 family protein
MNRAKQKIKFVVGILISLLCLYVAFRKVDFGEMWQAASTANYWYMAPVLAVIFLSHYLRSLRWRYLLDPLSRIDTISLFSSLMIGYGANLIMPAHLGEFLRAYVLSKKRQIPLSPVFATIVVERIIDIFSLLVLMLLAFFVYPFPEWLVKSGYIMLACAFGLLAFLFFLKMLTPRAIAIVDLVLRPLPEKLAEKIGAVIEKFVSGIMPMRRWHDYVTVGILSVIIWACYGIVFFFCLHAFDFVKTYNLTWSVSLVLLVITTIAVIVPSSPGYVGTYHYLCQITLAMFGVPAGPALSFATVVHGANFFPVLIAGLLFAQYEGMTILRTAGNESNAENEAQRGLE